MASTSGNATAGDDSSRVPTPVPELPDIMVMMMYTLAQLEPDTRDQYPNIPDNAVVVLIKGMGLRRVDDDYDS